MNTFPPTRAAGLERLQAFAPAAGSAYAQGRNFDEDADGRSAVSKLSPYLRHRLIHEREVIDAVLAHHSAEEAQKFLQEVFWRTYWKGWLDLRPSIWSEYKSEVQAGLNRLQTEAGLRQEFDAACRGETAIDCFNYWSQTLVSNGYLHNHARMWFASIWIFTLRLPWALGADFFLRHLLDGDPASNTLSWRWVAGMQTKGKTYLARADNIATYTRGRFSPDTNTLANHAPALPSAEHPAPRTLPLPAPALDGAPSGWLMHEDDLSAPETGIPVCALQVTQSRSPLAMSERVEHFTRSALSDALTRAGGRPIFDTAREIADWAEQNSLDQIITPYAPTGPVAEALGQLETALSARGITLTRRLDPYDEMCWPHATIGYFPFKENIPDFLSNLR